MIIRRNPDCSIDEIVGHQFHLEQMDDGYWHLTAEDWHIQITSKSPITVNAELDAPNLGQN